MTSAVDAQNLAVVRAAVALVPLVSVGCYDPSIGVGVPCGPGGECPTGQTCVAARCADSMTGPGGADAASDAQYGGPDAAISCVDRDLGSVLGASVATGTTVGQGDDYDECSGGGPDVTFGWIAPKTGTFRFDLCGSSFDTIIAVLPGSCTARELACGNDDCTLFNARADVALMAGQAVVIIVDGDFSSDEGDYQLSITQL